MSLNKVLNRPMFRKEALRKGVLKTINANTGVMVGTPYENPNQNRPPLKYPMTSNPQGFFGRNIRPYLQRAKPYAKGIGSMLSLPGYAGMEATGQVLNAFGIEDPKLRIPLQAAGAYGATKLPGAAALSGLGMGPQAGITAALGLGYMGYLEQQKFNALPEAEKKKIRAEQQAFSDSIESDGSMSRALFTKSPGKEAIEKVKKESNIVELPSGAKPGSGRVNKVVPQDNLTAEENIQNLNNKELVDLNKVVENGSKKSSDGSDPSFFAPQPAGEDNNENKLSVNKGTVSVLDAETEDNTGKKIGLNDKGKVNGKEYSSELMQKAKLITKEMMEGRTSNAKTIFLANLASGLMSGKTSQSGLAGAIDVLGQALGPAANNYGIMKLKENEIENQLMGQAIDIALAEYKVANTNNITKGSLGRVQFLGPKGKVKNFDGGINENGVPYLLVNGQQVAAMDLTGTELATLMGQPELKDFKYAQATIKDEISDDEAKAHRLLLQNVKSKNIVYDVKEIIRATGAAGTKGNLNIALTKLNSIMNDFGLGSTKDAISKLDGTMSEFNQSLELGYKSGDLTKEQYKMLKKGFDKDNIQEKIEEAAEKNYKIKDPTTGKLRKPTTNELFELVNAQTTLAYALANSFKDTDRLTQKDVTAAMSVINILPSLGGAETAMASLNALEKDLDRSIDSTLNRLERTYFTNDMVIKGFLSLLKGGDQFGKFDSAPISNKERNDILQGIQL